MVNQVVLVGKVSRHDTMTTHIELENKEEIPIPHDYLSTEMQDGLRSIQEGNLVGIKGHITKVNGCIQIQASKLTFVSRESDYEHGSRPES